jgi:predicted ATPase
MTTHTGTQFAPAARSKQVTAFLASAAQQVSGLVVEGEPGIGKTTAWSAIIERAVETGFRVLSARAGSAEVVLTFAVLADLFSELEPSVLAELPELQRVAVDRLLAQAGDSPATNERVLGAAFLSAVARLAADQPVLIAVDDVQWLDASSEAALSYAVRRLKGRVGVLVTARSSTTGEVTAPWLQLRRADGVDRISLAPMTIGDLHKLFAARLGRSLPRPRMVRIADVSRGNPFYALELARAMNEPPGKEPTLPPSLSGLVRARLAGLGDDVGSVLLAAATASTPTVELLATATGNTVERVIELLDEAEAQGVIVFDGNRVQFSHPLLATGVYTNTSHAARRAIHRRLAELVQQPDARARHLAFAVHRRPFDVGGVGSGRGRDQGAWSSRGRRRTGRLGDQPRRRHTATPHPDGGPALPGR